MILFQDCIVKCKFKTRNLVKHKDPHSVKPRAKAGLGPTTPEWSPSRVPETHPAGFSIASVDPPSEFSSVNLPLIKCRSLIYYVYVAYFRNIDSTNVAITVCRPPFSYFVFKNFTSKGSFNFVGYHIPHFWNEKI